MIQYVETYQITSLPIESISNLYYVVTISFEVKFTNETLAKIDCESLIEKNIYIRELHRIYGI